MMLLSNLAEPEWIQIGCTEKVLVDLVCIIKTSHSKATNINNHVNGNSLICPINAISKDTRCFLFSWHKIKKSTDLKSYCKLNFAVPVQDLDIQYFLYLFDAIQDVLPPILYQTDKGKLYRFTYEKYLSIYHFNRSILSNTNVEGSTLCTLQKIFVINGENVFKCRSNVFISYLFVCDGILDCPIGDSDEEFCYCQYGKESKNINLCKELIDSTNNETVCSTLYFTAKDSCHKYITPTNLSKKHTKINFVCSDKRIIDMSLKNDLVIDCPNSAEDEETLMSLLQFEQISLCRRKYEIACKQGHPKCYNISDICTYRINFFGRIQPCSNGAHLQNCEKFECNIMFKCVKSYCIPWSYVCDGKWDCSNGEDETYTQICEDDAVCSNMFKCRGEKHKCLHVGNTCDGTIDCPQGDDEYLCELKYHSCPTKCNCLTLAIDCSNIDYYSFSGRFYPHILVFMSHSHSVGLENTMSTFSKVQYLTLRHNGISKVCCILTSKSILSLDFSHNYVYTIKRHCFTGLHSVTSIILHSNYINTVQSQAFYNLFDLKFIDLSNNFLTKLYGNIIKGSAFLKLLMLKNISAKYLDKNLFDSTKFKVMHTNDYRLCCVAGSHSICTAFMPWYISCNNLLPNSMMRWSFIFMSIFIIIINGISITTHSMKYSMKAYSVCVIVINISDIICGLYLGIIWISDIFFKGEFILSESKWRSSTVCFLAFGIVVYAALTNQLVLAMLALTRLMVVINPLHTIFKNCRYVFGFAIVICFISFLSTVVTTLYLKFSEHILPTSLCLPFIDPTNSIFILKALIWSVTCGQCVTSLFITVSHIILVRRLTKDHEKLNKTKWGSKHSNIFLLLQLIVVTFSNMICWFSTNTIYIITMFVQTYPTHVVIWMTVFLLPLNSIINPIVFILTNFRKN